MNMNPFENDDLKRLIFTYMKQPKKHYLGNSPSYDAIKDFCFGIEREQLHVLNPLLRILQDSLAENLYIATQNKEEIFELTLEYFFYITADSQEAGDIEDLFNDEVYDPETNMTELHYYGDYELNELTLTPT